MAEACLVFDMERLKNRDLKTQFRRRGRQGNRSTSHARTPSHKIRLFFQRQNVSEIARGLSFADMQHAELEGQSRGMRAV